MPEFITSIAPTTETEAVNEMLSAIGKRPVADASASTQADVVMAKNELMKATRELQSTAWRFNSEAGVEIAPTTTFPWADSTGNITLLNVFTLPAQAASWKQTLCQQNGDLDLVWRPAKQVVDELDAPLMVLYDRSYNRDGVDATRYPFVYIDLLYSFNFQQMPETARRLAAVTAGRRFTQKVVGSQTLVGFTQLDEALARRILNRDQGDQQSLNMLDTFDSFGIMGRRARPWGGYMQVVRPGANPEPVELRIEDGGGLRLA